MWTASEVDGLADAPGRRACPAPIGMQLSARPLTPRGRRPNQRGSGRTVSPMSGRAAAGLARMGRTFVSVCMDKVRAMDGAMQSALIVTIPEAEEAVALHRAQFDEPAGFGIPAHVTVLSPFLPPAEVDAHVVGTLAAAISTIPRFNATFESTGWFGTNVLWLAPKPAAVFGALTSGCCGRLSRLPALRWPT